MELQSNNEDLEQIKEDQEFYEHHKFVIEKGHTLMRIDKFLINRIENVSRNKIQNAAKADCVLVNGKPVKSSYKVKPYDLVSVVMPEPPRVAELIPEDIPVDILYYDDDITIINKKPGMVVHPGFGNYRGTLVNALAFFFQDKKNSLGEEYKPTLVHRIDKNTSGIIVVANNEVSQIKMAKYFFDRNIDRLYVALVWGDMKNEAGTIVGNIGRGFRDRKVMDVFPEGSEYGKHAITHYKVIERFGYVTLIQCKLETGRTHQIRAHMRHIGHPLFNDDTYGGNEILKGTTFTKYKQFVENCFKILPRHALHAKTLGFVHPSTGERIDFYSELPDDMQDVIEKWRNYSHSLKLVE